MKGRAQHPTAKYGRREASREINGENVGMDGPDGKAWIAKDEKVTTKETRKETAGRPWKDKLARRRMCYLKEWRQE